MDNIKTKQHIQNIINKFPESTQIAIARVCEDSVIFNGFVKENNIVKQIDNRDAIFEIGSITKVFTSSLLAQMFINKQINIEANIDLGFSLKNNAQITYKELATHSSGLPGMPLKMMLSLLFTKNDNPYKDFDESRLVNYLKNDLKLKTKGKLRYSNVGAGLLGHALSQQLNLSYDELLRQKLLSKLEMHSTTTIREQLKDKLVTGLDKKGNKTTNWDLNILAGAGAALSSAADMSKFILANIENNCKAFDFQKQYHLQNGKQSMGLGWFILKDLLKGMDEIYFHNGGTGGYRSSMAINMKNQTGIIVLSNVTTLTLFKNQKIDQLAFRLLKDMK